METDRTAAAAVTVETQASTKADVSPTNDGVLRHGGSSADGAPVAVQRGRMFRFQKVDNYPTTVIDGGGVLKQLGAFGQFDKQGVSHRCLFIRWIRCVRN